MNNKCIYLKQKLNHKLVCKRTNKEISLSQCRECDNKEYKKCTIKPNSLCKNDKKSIKMHNQSAKGTKKNTKMHSQSAKLKKLERNRFSLFTNDHDHCMICHSTYQLTWHEIFGGRNRTNSMRYGLCLKICLKCHETLQNDANFNEIWHKKGQVMFNNTYPDLDFKNIFHINYL